MVSVDKPRNWSGKFAAAFAGIFWACRSQSSMRVHATCGGLAVILAAVLRLNAMEWAVLLLVIGFVIGLELVNTAIEALVDHVSPEYSEWARIAKDTAAGAVLVAAMTAMAVGVCLFLPHWSRN